MADLNQILADVFANLKTVTDAEALDIQKLVAQEIAKSLVEPLSKIIELTALVVELQDDLANAQPVDIDVILAKAAETEAAIKALATPEPEVTPEPV